MVPLKDLVPLTEEELKKASAQARGILGAVVAGFHHRVPELLARLATWEPEKALKLYIELMEYQTPKLQRVEQTGGVDHRHQVFVPVEQRDRDPRVIDARVIEREEDPSEPAPVPVREQRDADDAPPGNGGADPVHAEAPAVPAVEPEAVPPWEDASGPSSVDDQG